MRLSKIYFHKSTIESVEFFVKVKEQVFLSLGMRQNNYLNYSVFHSIPYSPDFFYPLFFVPLKKIVDLYQFLVRYFQYYNIK